MNNNYAYKNDIVHYGSVPPVQVPDISARGGVVFRAAEHATRLLRQLGYTCAIFGSAACFLYGNKRLPNDVDILISTDEDPEVIKRSLVNNNLHFYLVPAKTPGATYKVLWYQCDRLIRVGRREIISTVRTKVDIVVAGTMMLPALSSQSIIVKGAFPVVPLEVLLLHKLQGLFDHVEAPELHKQKKIPVDVEDIQDTLKIAVRSLGGTERAWASAALDFFEKEFQESTVDRVKLFCSVFSECRDDWYQLGFEVDIDDE
ncbi:hypothetical protein IW261DRAFT_1404807 [Armillaria novae-zelandiae]|uniref:Uncharacterized protein n=1 Tax=Armillaria novae-zelandiae TaxID=153914 RepID=A0AA39TXS4_9AGAR|nr:hypothetical protein IW261DRAFT_1404807 [Armillaria novae-zelandiae]